EEGAGGHLRVRFFHLAVVGGGLRLLKALLGDVRLPAGRGLVRDQRRLCSCLSGEQGQSDRAECTRCRFHEWFLSLPEISGLLGQDPPAGLGLFLRFVVAASNGRSGAARRRVLASWPAAPPPPKKPFGQRCLGLLATMCVLAYARTRQ